MRIFDACDLVEREVGPQILLEDAGQPTSQSVELVRLEPVRTFNLVDAQLLAEHKLASGGEGTSIRAVAEDIEELLAVCHEGEVSRDSVYVLVHVAEPHALHQGLLGVVLVRFVYAFLVVLCVVHAPAVVQVLKELRVEPNVLVLWHLGVEVREA